MRLGGPLSVYTDTVVICGINRWFYDVASGTPLVYHNPTTATLTCSTAEVPAGGLGLHPGANNEYSVVRFSAPIGAEYRIMGSFVGQDTMGTTTDVHVLGNGVALFNGQVTGFGPASAAAFDFTCELGVNDHLDFAVGYGANTNHLCDSTGLSARVVLLSLDPWRSRN